MGDETELHHEEESGRPGESVAFPFDRMSVQRFRETFPRARWSDERKAWFVPGTTARRRIDRWLAREASRADAFADEKGRDAFEFEPILSPYLDVVEDGFRVRTPYSRTIVDELRQVPFARWDVDLRVWHIPFASYDDLLRHWKRIEEAAKRNEPEERRKRAEARKGTDEDKRSRRRASERRRHRIPVPENDLPPLDRPVATRSYGIIVVSEVTGELIEATTVADLYPDLRDEHVWAVWRSASLEELIHTWPAKKEPGEYENSRGWWQPTIEELREARRKARFRERRAALRASI